jgi:hypothetical protein
MEPTLLEKMKSIVSEASKLPFEEKVYFLNEARSLLHEISPFKAEPVDFVKWVPAETVKPNDYNPNFVAPNEMKLLEISIKDSGFTQPIVVSYDADEQKNIVVDGFHRNEVGRNTPALKKRLNGYLPITELKGKTRSERQAATIEHNRARGKHEVDGMGEIVRDMVQQGVSEDEITRVLGMSAEEFLRLKQISGIAAMMANTHYARAWEAVDADTENSILGNTGSIPEASRKGKNIIPE